MLILHLHSFMQLARKCILCLHFETCIFDAHPLRCCNDRSQQHQFPNSEFDGNLIGRRKCKNKCRRTRKWKKQIRGDWWKNRKKFITKCSYCKNVNEKEKKLWFLCNADELMTSEMNGTRTRSSDYHLKISTIISKCMC